MKEPDIKELEKMLKQAKEELKLYELDVVVLRDEVYRIEKLIAERKQYKKDSH